MCSQFTQEIKEEEVATLFGVEKGGSTTPLKTNMRPTDPILAIRVSPTTGKQEKVLLRWGLIPPGPSWATESALQEPRFNARAETVDTKPTYRAAFKSRRCLIPSTYFKEKAYRIGMKDGRMFAMAGLWESWTSTEGEVVESCTIITTEPNELVASVHHRMPVILDPQDFELWLDPQVQDTEKLKCLLKTYPAEDMTATEEQKQPKPKKQSKSQESKDDGQGTLFDG